MKRIYFIIFLSTISVLCNAQTQQEKIQQDITQRQAAAQTALDRVMEKGIEQMNTGDYEAANKSFKEVLDNARVIPTEMTYYFGKNSFYLEKYAQSIDWLNKYIQLKGTKGRFYEEAAGYLEQANKAVLLLRKQDAEATQEVLAASYEIDCGPTGLVVCPVCKGKTVIITKTSFGENYRECPYSDEHGYLTCAEYNLLLKGQLEQK